MPDPRIRSAAPIKVEPLQSYPRPGASRQVIAVGEYEQDHAVAGADADGRMLLMKLCPGTAPSNFFV
ncbi:hypothetical protein ABIA94_006805 [Bradyrhizobium sp. LA7.1]